AYRAGQGLRRATTIGGRFSIAKLFQIHAITTPRADVSPILGRREFSDTRGFHGAYFGRGGTPKDLPDHYTHYGMGWEVAAHPGSRKGSIIAFKDGTFQEVAAGQRLFVG